MQPNTIEKQQLLNSLKFVELHFHLDGSVTPDIALEISEATDFKLPSTDPAKLKEILSVPPGCTSLTEFLKHFDLPGSLMQTKEGISEAVYRVQEHFKKNNGIYLEIRFAPQFHIFKGLTQREVIEAALEGLHRSDLKANLILCLMRIPNNKEANLETIRLCKEFLVEDDGVVALDLAGDEFNFKTKNYKEEFELASNLGIPFTIHAGEADGHTSVDAALSFGTKRIGHGIRAIESKETMQKIKENDVLLEVCPLSNFATNSATKKDYPFKKLLDYGIKMCINTDDMGIIGNTLKDDFEFLIDEYGIGKKEISQMMNNAIDGAFTTQETKEYLKDIIAEM